MDKAVFVDYFKSIWFTWSVTTFIYVVLDLLGYISGEHVGTPLGYVAGFIGLFVPYGLTSLMLFVIVFYGWVWISLIFFIFAMREIDKRLKEIEISLCRRILLNLLLLVILTTLVDLIRGTDFASWSIFFSGGEIPFD